MECRIWQIQTIPRVSTVRKALFEWTALFAWLILLELFAGKIRIWHCPSSKRYGTWSTRIAHGADWLVHFTHCRRRISGIAATWAEQWNHACSSTVHWSVCKAWWDGIWSNRDWKIDSISRTMCHECHSTAWHLTWHLHSFCTRPFCGRHWIICCQHKRLKRPWVRRRCASGNWRMQPKDWCFWPRFQVSTCIIGIHNRIYLICQWYLLCRCFCRWSRCWFGVQFFSENGRSLDSIGHSRIQSDIAQFHRESHHRAVWSSCAGHRYVDHHRQCVFPIQTKVFAAAAKGVHGCYGRRYHGMPSSKTLPLFIVCFTRFKRILPSLQVALGISTLLTYVPVSLAATHQSGSLILLSMAVWLSHELKLLKYLPK